MVIRIFAGEGPLGRLLPGNVKLFGSQLSLPFRLSLLDPIDFDDAFALAGRIELDDPDRLRFRRTQARYARYRGEQ